MQFSKHENKLSFADDNVRSITVKVICVDDVAMCYLHVL